jgi:nitrous oxidase accessory protein
MWPSAALLVAAFMLILSTFVPYWKMVLKAPQYPNGLSAVVYIDDLEGDIGEIDELNHYLGMPSLRDGGRAERSISVLAIVSMALLLIAAVFIHNRTAAVLALPVVAFPLAFLADMKWILYHFGHSIDPHSALGGAISPFTPPVWGVGTVGQFSTESTFGPGLWLAFGASCVVLGALWLHRRAWKPVMEAQREVARRTLQPLGATVVVLLCLATSARAASAETRLILVAPQGSTPTIAAGLLQARDGDTVRVAPGIYHEHVVVDRKVRLEAFGGGQAVIDGDGRGTVVRVTAPGVVVKGFVIRGSGAEPDTNDAGLTFEASDVTVCDNRFEDVLFGVFSSHAARGRMVGNDVSGKAQYEAGRKGDGIRLWYSRDNRIENNYVHHCRDIVAWYSGNVLVANNRIEDGRYAVHFMYTDGARVLENAMLRNSVGVYTMYTKNIRIERNRIVSSRGPSGYALGFKDVDDVTVADNRLADSRVGIFMDGAPLAIDTFCRIQRNVLAYNDIGIAMLPSVERAEFCDNAFVENHEQVSIMGGGSAEACRFSGNYWSDYAGYDADGDGYGDVAYASDELFENLSDRSPELNLFQGSLAQQAVDMAARMFPLVRPVPKLHDDRPRMALAAQVATSGAGRQVRMAWLGGPSAVLLLLGLFGLRSQLPTRHGSGTGAVHRRYIPGIFLRCLGDAGETVPAVGPDRDAAIEIRGLTKAFGRFVAVDGIDLVVRPGEAVALWGANGAGKTTVLRCLLGLLPCDGVMRVGGRDVRTEGIAVRTQLGYVPQELRFHDDLSVRETVELYASLRCVTLDEGLGLLEPVGLSAARDKKVGELSGGMKQRLALALALLGNPPLLLLDEPASNLDLAGRREFLALLAQLKAQGKTLLFSAHHVEELASIADRVVLFEQGRIVRTCTGMELGTCA